MAAYLSRVQRWWLAGFLMLAAIWFGMLLGVSFLATPAKFLAPSLSLPVALDVGRHTFAVFNKAEWILAALLLGFALAQARTWLFMTAAVIAALLVAAETLWLLPLLDERVGMIIAGQQPGPAHLHAVYVAFEVTKLVALLLIMVDAAKCVTRLPQDKFHANVPSQTSGLDAR
jgi:hypothetical protein